MLFFATDFNVINIVR